MKHAQILEKISSRSLTQSMEEDIAKLSFFAMCAHKNEGATLEVHKVLPRLLVRWNCVLKAEEDVSDTYKQKTWLAMATLLHKYGFSESSITKRAIKSIDELNKQVALSDSFERQSQEIKKFLLEEPKALKRYPAMKSSVTFYRAKEAISIQLDKKFYAAFIHEITGTNESAKIEIYDAVFDKIPTLDQLKGLKARGQKYNDGLIRASCFTLHGMKFLPDPANQIKIIGSSLTEKPSKDHLKPAISAYAMSDLFRIQEIIGRMFAPE
jgi:hypothetical protein